MRHETTGDAMDTSNLAFVLLISLLLPVGFVIGYATHALVALVSRTSEGSWSVSD
jgi:hypothetical protein